MERKSSVYSDLLKKINEEMEKAKVSELEKKAYAPYTDVPYSSYKVNMSDQFLNPSYNFSIGPDGAFRSRVQYADHDNKTKALKQLEDLDFGRKIRGE